MPEQEAKKRKGKSRGNGTGTAYKRGDTWTASVVVGWKASEDGTHKTPIWRRKGGFKKKSDALNYCSTLLAGGVETKKDAPRLSHYWETYKSTGFLELSKSKQCAYKIAWGRLSKIQDVRVDMIDVQMLQSVVNETCDSYYPAKDVKNLLSNLFKMIGAERHSDATLPSFIKLPSQEEKETTPFSQEEQAALWKLYESGDLRACIPLLMIYSGMMPGEAQKLKVEHINLETQIIFGAGMKTNVRKKTPIVIADGILPVVQDLIDHAQPSGYIWKRVEKEWYDDYYAALEKAGCRRLAPYSCRHTTATALAVTKNVAPQTIRKVMRWSTTKELDRYAHPEIADAIEAVNAI